MKRYIFLGMDPGTLRATCLGLRILKQQVEYSKMNCLEVRKLRCKIAVVFPSNSGSKVNILLLLLYLLFSLPFALLLTQVLLPSQAGVAQMVCPWKIAPNSGISVDVTSYILNWATRHATGNVCSDFITWDNLLPKVNPFMELYKRILAITGYYIVYMCVYLCSSLRSCSVDTIGGAKQAQYIHCGLIHLLCSDGKNLAAAGLARSRRGLHDHGEIC